VDKLEGDKRCNSGKVEVGEAAADPGVAAVAAVLRHLAQEWAAE
jgi:hypothetical protein